MPLLKSTVLLVIALLLLQRATTYLIPLSSLFLLLPFGLLLVLLASLPISILFGLFAESRCRPPLPTSASSAAQLREALRPLHLTTSPSASAASSPSIHPSLSSSLSSSLRGLISKIIDEFVLSWYLRISPDASFPNRLEQTITHALGEIITRLESTDLPSLVVSTIIPHITSHLLSSNNAERSLKRPSASTSPASPVDTAADLFLAQAYTPASLHPAVSPSSLETRPAQEAHMRGLVEGILELILEESERKSRAVLVIAREVVLCAVLMPIVEMMSDPDFWNKILDEQAGNYIRQQKLVSQLRSALDQTITRPSSTSPRRREASLPLETLNPNPRLTRQPSAALSESPSKPSISSNTSSRSFESFVRGIGRMESLMDLRRLRNDLGGEIRKTKGILEGLHQQQQQNIPPSTTSVADLSNERRPGVLRAHLERLYEARGTAESRIVQLSADASSSSILTSPSKSSRHPVPTNLAVKADIDKLSSVTPSPSHKLHLRDVLVNPSTVGYFLEFMERRGGMLPVQFWLIVEGFKDPLDDDAERRGDDAHGVLRADIQGRGVEKDGRDDAVEIAREDMRAVWEGYFEPNLLGEEIVDRYGPSVQKFVEGQGQSGLAQARQSLFLAQKSVYSQLLEDHYPSFKVSDLYFKALSGTSPISSMPLTTRIPAPISVPHPPSFPHRQTAPSSLFAVTAPAPSASASSITSIHVRSPSPTFAQPSSPTPSTSSSLFSSRMRDPKGVRSLLQHSTSAISIPQVSFDAPNFDKKVIRNEARASMSTSSSSSSLHPSNTPSPALQRSFTSPSYALASGEGEASVTTPSTRSLRPELDFLIGLTAQEAASDRAVGQDTSSRAPLFDESESSTDMLLVHHPESDEEAEADYIQIQRMDAIQAALTSIIAKDEASSASFSPTTAPFSNPSTSVRRSKSISETSRRISSESSMARSLEAPPSRHPGTPSTSSPDDPAPPSLPSIKSFSSPLSEPTEASKKPPRKRVFEEDDADSSILSAQATPVLSQHLDSDDEDQQAHESVSCPSRLYFASPGDLQLPAEIARLGEKIATLRSQEPILDALIRKAELTGAEAELVLLIKSFSALQQEVRALVFQRNQFEQQELENRLEPGRTRITIPGTMEGNGSSSSTMDHLAGKVVVRYLIQVEQLGKDGDVKYGWVIRRRYNDFWELQKGLKENVKETRGLSLPGKMGGLGVAGMAISTSWVDARRVALEKYMQSLVVIPEACVSPELRAFLSQTPAHSPLSTSPLPPQKPFSSTPFLPQNLVKQLYRTVATGIDETLSPSPSSYDGGTGGPASGGNPVASMLDLIGQRLTRQAGEFASLAGLGLGEAAGGALKASSAGLGAMAKATSAATSAGSISHHPHELDLSPELKPLGGETASSYFTAPICDLFIEIFELKENNWLRRQAIVIILQQLLGGTIERKLRDVFRALTSGSSILKYLSSFSNGMWPDGGARRPPSVPRTPEQKLQTKMDASKKISSLMPEVAANMLGRSNARRGARRLFSVVQNQRLNQHLVHTIIDEVVFALFPELKKEVPTSSPNR